MSKITAMYIRLSMEDEDVSLNQKEESNSVSSQRELLESFIGNYPDSEGIILKSVVFWSRYFHFIRYGLLQLMTIMTAIIMMVPRAV